MYPLRPDVATLAQLGVGGSILAVSLFELYSPDIDAGNPGEYGLFAYSMALLCVLLTGLFPVQFLLFEAMSNRNVEK